MSALALVMQADGNRVSGCDRHTSHITEFLARSGIAVSDGHDLAHIKEATAVVVTAAVPQDEPELVEARRLGRPVVLRSEALAGVVRSLRTVAVSGTHGKTTTAAMTAHILESAGLDPTFLIGADLPDGSPGGHRGKGDLAVVEADEAFGSFLALKPAIAVVTSIDADHIDFYGSFENVKSAFVSFMEAASEARIISADDDIATSLAPEDAFTFGFDPRARVRPSRVDPLAAGGSAFELEIDGHAAGRVRLDAPGRYNVANSLAAAAAAHLVGVKGEDIARALSSYRWPGRRFERRGSFRGADLVDDYAHHPRELSAVLGAARELGYERLTVVFQPHLYSRTQLFADEFAEALAIADVVVLTDVYAAREDPIPGVGSKMIVDRLAAWRNRRVVYMPSLESAARFVASTARSGDLVMSLGAGDITELFDLLEK